jgi:hypothetical protein
MTTASSTNLNAFARKAPPRGLYRWIPGFAMLRDYRPEWLVKDIAAGLVLTALLVPDRKTLMYRMEKFGLRREQQEGSTPGATSQR